MSDLTILRAEISTITTESEAEQVGEVWEKVELAKRALKEIKDRLDAELLAWCEVNGSFEVGEIRFYAGDAKETKCIDKAVALEALATVLRGDVSAMAEVLAAQPFKNAEARKVLGDAYDASFKTETKRDLKTGEPLRELYSRDKRFLKAKTVPG